MKGKIILILIGTFFSTMVMAASPGDHQPSTQNTSQSVVKIDYDKKIHCIYDGSIFSLGSVRKDGNIY